MVCCQGVGTARGRGCVKEEACMGMLEVKGEGTGDGLWLEEAIMLVGEKRHASGFGVHAWERGREACFGIDRKSVV